MVAVVIDKQSGLHIWVDDKQMLQEGNKVLLTHPLADQTGPLSSSHVESAKQRPPDITSRRGDADLLNTAQSLQKCNMLCVSRLVEST